MRALPFTTLALQVWLIHRTMPAIELSREPRDGDLGDG